MILVILVVVGLLLAGGITWIASLGPLRTAVFVWAIIGSVLFNALLTLVRWLVTRSGRRIFLRGYYPLTLGLLKLTGFVATIATLFICLVAFLIERQTGGWIPRAVVLSFGVFALIASSVNGFLNAIIVRRQLNGTLAETSYDKRPPTEPKVVA